MEIQTMASFPTKTFTTPPTAPVATTPPTTPVAPAPVVEPVAEAPVTEAVETETEKKKRAERLTYTPEMLQTVIDYSNSVSTKDLAEQLGITSLQVNAIRKKIQRSLRDRLANKLGVPIETLYEPLTPEKEGDKAGIDFDKPIHEEAQKLEAKIAEKFTKEKSASTPRKSTNASKVNIDKLVDTWLNDL
jgi:transcriptional regulator with XRE-family HTH domain